MTCWLRGHGGAETPSASWPRSRDQGRPISQACDGIPGGPGSGPASLRLGRLREDTGERTRSLEPTGVVEVIPPCRLFVAAALCGW